MKFKVIGENRETGRRMSMELEADCRIGAEHRAAAMGMVVRHVGVVINKSEPEQTPPPAESAPAVVAPVADAPAAQTAVATAAPPTRAMESIVAPAVRDVSTVAASRVRPRGSTIEPSPTPNRAAPAGASNLLMAVIVSAAMIALAIYLYYALQPPTAHH
jgi:hypothetical protein